MLLLMKASLSLLTLLQAKTLIIQTADSADAFSDVGPDVTAEEDEEAETSGDYRIVMDRVKAGFD